ncbi:MAG: choice-of-anchor Q domain-containing protein [Bacteroidota bacterium]
MKNIAIITVLLYSFPLLTTTQSLITIKQDGTGDYTTIQEGVDAANNGDTVLVFPGIYYENIFYDTTSLTIGSLALTTGDSAYISQTIIDGNQAGTCIRIYFCEEKSTIYGFTIRNGRATGEGTIGGGLFLFHSQIDVYKCVIENNIASGYGGGVCSYESDTYLSGVTIRYNHCYEKGGGLMVAVGSVVFDTTDKCSIYMNYASEGTDIAKNGFDSIHVVVDTFTVANPDYYYIYSTYGSVIRSDITYSINTGKLQTENQDLYVSNDGDNSNSGLTSADPLKDIWFALLKMESDSLQPDTIHVANGMYKNSNGEKFPLSLKGYVSIKGTSRDHTIFDGEDEIFLLKGIVKADNYQVSKLTLQHGNGDKNSYYHNSVARIYYNRFSSFDSLLIQENIHSYNSTRIVSSNGFEVNHVDFINNVGGKALRIYHIDVQFTYRDTLVVKNCTFINNLSDYTISGEEGGSGGGIFTLGELNSPNLNTVYIFNSLFAKNHSRMHPYGGYTATAIGASRFSNMHIINCTFSRDTSDNPYGGNIGVTSTSDVHIYNSILYDNYPAELYMYNDNGLSNLNIYNSLVQGGEEGINIYTSGNTLNYDPTNIDTDPLFDTTSMYPYSLSSGSPCIDAGTVNLPGIELPETDLAGNPRVYNGYVDMGAYEYGPWVGIQDQNSKPKTQNLKLLEVFPNPFRFETNISYINPEKGNCIIRVYDLSGRYMKTLIDVHGQSGEGTIKWRGNDNAGNALKPGTYILAIIVNGKERDAVKIVKR